jgi:Resolvase, N terminal domain/Helix-turn-helix domain of resolvase
VRTIRAKGATLRATEQPIDTSTAAGKAFLDMLGVFAEFETNLRRERQLEGIAAAKAKGVYKGRPASIDAAQISALRADGLGPTEIAKRLGVARASVYRVLGHRRRPRKSAVRSSCCDSAIRQCRRRDRARLADCWAFARPSWRLALKDSSWNGSAIVRRRGRCSADRLHREALGRRRQARPHSAAAPRASNSIFRAPALPEDLFSSAIGATKPFCGAIRSGQDHSAGGKRGLVGYLRPKPTRTHRPSSRCSASRAARQGAAEGPHRSDRRFHAEHDRGEIIRGGSPRVPAPI